MKKISYLIIIVLCLSGCKGNRDITPALQSINAEDLKSDISILASDEFGGRAPATPGEQKTIEYLAGRFEKIGLKPANNGSWFQEVSMIKITAGPNIEFNAGNEKEKLSFRFPDDFIGGTPLTNEITKVDSSDMVFVGYGINAPEYNWNDYRDIDVKGKTVIIMVNDPGYATGDTALFQGRTMTYYGRWTYKYEEAARQGAKAAIVVHETGAAGYPWAVVQNSWSGPQFYLENNEYLNTDLQFRGWITGEAALRIFKAAGLDYNELSAKAATREFKPVDLGLLSSIKFSNTIEHVKSNNVTAIWPGKKKPDEYVIYTSHWDHLGINPAFSGDSILNGAVDNATGTAALLEIAEAFTKLPSTQNRSVVFLAVTGEEQGLLGSEYYANNPIYPLNKTAAVINMDALNIFGSTKDMTIVGYGNSELDKYAEKILKKYGRYAVPDPTPEKGGYFRSDHFSFAKKGVPALYLSDGIDNKEHGKEWGLAMSEKWTTENYHKPSDNYEPDKWDFTGMIDDIKVYFETGYDISMAGKFPQWSRNFPFKPLRDEMMKKK
jgi:Zn-dependent M28 family amino/carboxypeptidase